jgi:hypothetical protein
MTRAVLAYAFAKTKCARRMAPTKMATTKNMAARKTNIDRA